MLDIPARFQGASIPDDEGARLYHLRQLEILDTLPEQVYDDLARLAAYICQTPGSGVTLIDADRQWFKTAVGLSISETPRDVSFCAHAILQPDLFQINDASLDERFRENPLVIGEEHIRFYAGAPLVTSEGYALGALCVIDHVPRSLSAEQKEALLALGRMTVAHLEQRRDTQDLISAIAERDRAQDQLAALQARLDALSGERESSAADPEMTENSPTLVETVYPAFLAGLTAGTLLGTLLHGRKPRV